MTKLVATIKGVYGYVPADVLSNKDLEQMVDTNDEWIRSRTGISERRILKDPSLASSDLGLEAVKGLLEKTNTDLSEIDLLICCTATPDMLFPATANLISGKLGLKDTPSFDIGAACSGFIYGLSVAKQFVENGAYKKVVLVGAEKMSSIVDYTDRSHCIIFGDGAGAVLIEATEEETGIIDILLKSDGVGSKHLHQKAGGSLNPATLETVQNKEHFIHQEGAAVFKFAVTKMAEISAQIMERNNLTPENLDWFVPHQANKRIIDAAQRRMGLPDEKVMLNIQKFGNTTSATIPLCLWEWEDKLKKGDNLVLSAFGGGFTWAAAYLKWSY